MRLGVPAEPITTSGEHMASVAAQCTALGDAAFAAPLIATGSPPPGPSVERDENGQAFEPASDLDSTGWL